MAVCCVSVDLSSAAVEVCAILSYTRWWISSKWWILYLFPQDFVSQASSTKMIRTGEELLWENSSAGKQCGQQNLVDIYRGRKAMKEASKKANIIKTNTEESHKLTKGVYSHRNLWKLKVSMSSRVTGIVKDIWAQSNCVWSLEGGRVLQGVFLLWAPATA